MTIGRHGGSDQAVVVHVTETLNAGVRGVIEDYARANPDFKHVVVGRERRRLPVECPMPYLEYRVTRTLREWSRAVWRSTRDLRPGVVHFHSSAAGLLAVALPRPSRTARVYTPHCFYFRRTDLSPPVRVAAYAAEKLIASRVGTCAAVGIWEYSDAVRVGYGHRRTRLVPNGVAPISLDNRSPAAPTPTVVGVGRVGRQKGSSFFGEVARLCRVKMDTEFIWVGGGSEEDVEELQRSGVKTTGWVPRSQAIEHLARASLYLHCSEWDSVPLTLLEAADLGVPVVARESAALRHLGVDQLWRSPREAASVVLGVLTGSAPSSTVPARTSQLHSDESFVRSARSLYYEVLRNAQLVADAPARRA
jgi:glycosyltransferase involved in cell wall biosynthesis